MTWTPVETWLLVAFLLLVAGLCAAAARVRRQDAAERITQLVDMTPSPAVRDLVLWEAALRANRLDEQDAEAHMARLAALHLLLDRDYASVPDPTVGGRFDGGAA